MWEDEMGVDISVRNKLHDMAYKINFLNKHTLLERTLTTNLVQN